MTARKCHRTGWAAIADGIARMGLGTIFGLPSDDLDLLGALEGGSTPMVLTRDQRNAMFMSVGHAMTTGRPTVCVVGKGPAVTNAMTGLLEARASAVPVVLVATGTATSRRGTAAFQELDQLRIVRPLVKWATVVDHPDRLAPEFERAVFVAANGAPGPVYLELPEDIAAAPVPLHEWRPLIVHRPGPDPQAVAEAVTAIRAATRPVLLIGGGARHRDGTFAIERLAETLGAAMFTTASGRGVTAEDHPLYCGLAGLYVNPRAAQIWARADLVIALGSRLEETVTFGWRRGEGAPTILQVNLSEPDLAPEHHGPIVLGDVARVVSELASRLGDRVRDEEWIRDVEAVQPASKRAVEARRAEITAHAGVPVGTVLAAISEVIPGNRILVQENGLQDMWSYFYPEYVGARAGFVAPSEQTSLGFGAAAAVGVRLAAPDRPVVAFVGDGAFNLFRADLETVAERSVPVLYIVIDNGGYGWLQRNLTRRNPASEFHFVRSDQTPPNSADPLRIDPGGIWSARVQTQEALVTSLRDAWRHCLTGRPAVLVITVDISDVAPALAELDGDFPAEPAS